MVGKLTGIITLTGKGTERAIIWKQAELYEKGRSCCFDIALGGSVVCLYMEEPDRVGKRMRKCVLFV